MIIVLVDGSSIVTQGPITFNGPLLIIPNRIHGSQTIHIDRVLRVQLQ